MLTFVLSDKIPFEHIGLKNKEIKSIRTNWAGPFDNENCLYIVDNKDRRFLGSIKSSVTQTPELSLNFLIVSGDDKEALEPDTSGFKKNDNYALITGMKDTCDAADLLEETLCGMIDWEISLSEKLLKESSIDLFLDSGKEYLPWTYIIFDRDMNTTYQSRYLSEYDPRNFVPYTDIFHSLVLDKKFHDAAEEKDIFYYHNDEAGASISYNLTVKEEFVARIVMLLDDEKKIHPGAEEIFKIFAEHVQDALTYGKFVPGHRPDDQAHIILQSLGIGANVPSELINMALEGYGRKNEILNAVVFRFYSDKGWHAQLEVTLPFLAIQLEREIPGSIAAATENEIIMLTVRKTVSEQDRQALYQKIVAFVRENICKAGVSADFDESGELSSAILSARAALETGENMKPDLWYYLFDDFRLEYMIAECKGKLSDGFICHRSLKILEKYDKEHKTQLNETLYVYLKNNLNMTAAANEIFIHRTSFFHRLNHIKELTGINLDDPDTVLELMISYRIKGMN